MRAKLRRTTAGALLAALAVAARSSWGSVDAFTTASCCSVGPSSYSIAFSASSSALSMSSTQSRPPSVGSYETFGDGALSDETFAELFGECDKDSDCDDDDDEEETRRRDALPEWLTDRCRECGWPTPTLVQQRSLEAILTGKDVVIQAQTGSGKTLSYLLPLLSKIDASRAAIQGMVVVPTRELGLQVSRVARRLAAASGPETAARGKIMVMPILQGSANRRQRAWAWAEPPHVVIGTPDELTKMVSRGGIRYNAIKFVVVDEVDACLLNNGGTYSSSKAASNLETAGPLHDLLSRYLSPTFEEADALDADSDGTGLISASATDLARAERTVSHGTDRQTVFASATIPQHKHFMRQCVQNQWTVREPRHVCASPGELIPPTLAHAYAVCDGMDNKLPGLRRMVRREVGRGRLTKALVFCDPRRPMERMAEAIAADLRGEVWSEGGRTAADDDDDDDGAAAVVTVLRYEESLSARAVAMDAFRGPNDRRGPNDDDNNNAPEPHDDANELEGEEDQGGITNGNDDDDHRDGTVRIMLSTDLAARGLDVSDVSHVINYDLPNDGDTYVHRGGRAGRLGRRGTVLSLITAEQEFVLERLANKLGLDVRCVARQEGKKRRGKR